MTTQLTAAGVDDLGSGEPALLLVPGWCGDRDVFDGLAARLTDHRAPWSPTFVVRAT